MLSAESIELQAPILGGCKLKFPDGAFCASTT
jgi:hypothetical protein